MMGRPSVTFTALPKPAYLITGRPWSWIHREHGVGLLQHVRRECGVGGRRADELHARAAQRVERRRDDFDLLASEVAGFAGVRIEAAHEDARRGDAEARAQIVVEDAQHLLAAARR